MRGGPAVSGYAPTVMRDGTPIQRKDPPQSPQYELYINKSCRVRLVYTISIR